MAARGHLKTVRVVHAVLAALALSACTATLRAVAHPVTSAAIPAATSCAARDSVSAIDWQISDETDARELARWCRAVGTPVFVPQPLAVPATPPALDDLVMVSWNAHLAEGELGELITKLTAGELTDGRPVSHFVLLVQELYRRGDAVPAFEAGDRSAFAIKGRDPMTFDIDDHAATLGLSVLYVPSMRNGPKLREDRGNAIISTEPLLDPLAIELPLARQRRVSLGAAINVATANGPRRLQLLDAHLEPLSSPKTLWVFKNPRGHQVRAILNVLSSPRYTDPRNAGVVLGGDFNTVRSGAGEEAYHLARRWSNGPAHEDGRDTHLMGRLDYLFFKMGDGWSATTHRLDARFGSDHFPVVGTFSR